MATSLAEEIKAQLIRLVRESFGQELAEVVVETPPQREMGDLAFPLAFELAKRLKAATGEKQNPRELAAKLAAGLRDLPGVSRVEIAGPGYLNLFFDRPQFFTSLLEGRPAKGAPPVTGRSGKLIVEHTSINPNKAAHIGHVRNAVLGDTTARILQATGEEVEVHNYIDNTGVQVADVVVGFLHLEKRSRAEIEALTTCSWTERGDSFDYYCWDLYARVGAWYEEDRSRLEIRAQTLHEIEAGDNPTAQIAELISSRIVDCHLATMARLDIGYDLLARESEILHLQFWAHAFEKLKETGTIVFETEGRNRGCWVMKAEGGALDLVPTEQVASDPRVEEEFDADKIIVRSNGTVTYTGKDIAYHLWKLGKLGLDFHYRFLHHDPRGRAVWVTTSQSSEAASVHPPFGNGTAFLNVIDVGQSYPQANVKRGVMMIDHDERVARSAHLAYEKVTLTPAAAAELGSVLSEADTQRQQIGMSGRKGLGVKADDLLDRLVAEAAREVVARHPELPAAEQQAIAHRIAVAALRYFLLKYTRTSIIAFDFREALSFDGETGPYLQYSTVRARKIFQKLGQSPESLRASFAQVPPDRIEALFAGEAGLELWSLVHFAGRFAEVLQLAASGFEPTHLAKYAFQLAKQFNLFYHHHHILSEPDETRRLLLLMVADLVRRTLEEALSILGIETPEMM
jgi:arginyl-tRNA synthetase